MKEIFENFIKKEVSQDIYNKYNLYLPQDLIEIWKEYGFGSIMNGYLKIINPDEYQELLNKTYFRGNISIPIFITAFGDIITFEENEYIEIVNYKKGQFNIIAKNFNRFYSNLNDLYFIEKYLDINGYEEAIKMIGYLKYNECFGYTPLLVLGGSEKVENLKKVKIKEHIEIITQLVGKIGM